MTSCGPHRSHASREICEHFPTCFISEEDDVGTTLESLQSGLKGLYALKSNVAELFTSLKNGLTSSHSDEEKEKVFFNELKTSMTNVEAQLRDVEAACTRLGSSNKSLHLGNSGLLSLDPVYGKTSLQSDLSKSYQWFDKNSEFSKHVSSILTRNSLKRTNATPFLAKKILRLPPSGHNVSQQTVDSIVSQLHYQFPDLRIKIYRPRGTSSELLITLPGTLNAVILLRGLLIERVVIKGISEDVYSAHCVLDMWSRSRFKVFHKITDHANAAMLHFYSPHLPDLALESFMVWLKSYQTLFSVPCCQCGKFLLNYMPPTWKDVRNLDIYHEDCRP